MARRELDEDRIYTYLMALYEALKRKRSKFKMTDFRRTFGISPHVQAAAIELGYVTWDVLPDETREWRWTGVKPTHEMAAKVLAGYRVLTFAYKENAKAKYHEDVATATKGKEATAIEIGKANKERFKKAIADTTPVIPDSWVCQKCGASIPAAMLRCQNCDLGMSAEDIQDMDEEAASELCEAEQIAEQEVPEEIHGVLREVVYVPMTENQWFFLLKLDAKINRLLRLHGADNVPEDRDA